MLFCYNFGTSNDQHTSSTAADKTDYTGNKEHWQTLFLS